MVCAQVVGNDAAVAWGGAAGNFELNVMLPMLGRNVLESIRLLANVSRLLADRCIDGITANVERLREYAESSPAIVTPLNRHLGYEEAASIAKQALAERKTIRQVVIERGHVGAGTLTEAELDEALDVMGMTHPVGSRSVAVAVASGRRQERVPDLWWRSVAQSIHDRVCPDQQVPADVRPQHVLVAVRRQGDR